MTILFPKTLPDPDLDRHVHPRRNKKPKIADPKHVPVVLDVETFTPTGSSNSNPISVDRYTTKTFIDLSADDILFPGFQPEHAPFAQRRRRQKVTEKGQSSNPQSDPKPFLCEICFEPKSQNESFSIKGCSHAYCSDCMSKYVASKLHDNVTKIGCPVSGCSGALEPGHCQRILPADVFDRWGSALCEAVILGAHKFYCPFKDCSAMLIAEGGEVIRESECPYCNRLFCAQCRAPWHSGIECGEFQKLGLDERGREDIMVRNLAKDKNWARCPSCSFYVEKVIGCNTVVCRCRVRFCYRCGKQIKRGHSCRMLKSS